MSDDEDIELQQFPKAITDAVNRHPYADNLTHLGSYTSLAKFIQTEIFLQTEQLRSNIYDIRYEWLDLCQRKEL
jgi:hypothetical protein